MRSNWTSMSRTGLTWAEPWRSRRPATTPARESQPGLDLQRPFTAAIPDSSVGAVRRVARLDGRTRIVAGRTPGGSWWKAHHRLPFTRLHVQELRTAGVSEVILRRGLTRASFPLAWLSERQT